MIEVTKVQDPRADKLREWADARMDRQEATIEYIAMMADVELPEGDGTDVEVRDEG